MSSTPHRFEQVFLSQVQSPLLEFSKDIASQCGEDGIIQKIFETIRPNNKYCVEFGAWDGKYLSNCWNLISNNGWSGLFIEGNEAKFKDLLATYGDNENVACVNKFVDFEGQNSLDKILLSINAPQDFDLLSIDVDGTDYFIWESLNEFKPNVIVIEFNPTIPNDIIFVQARDNSINQGCSLLALILLGKEKGYELICCTGWNAFFVKAELYAEFKISDNSIQSMYRPYSDGRIFHGYDSYVYVIGMPKLLWSDIQVSSDDFQVIPQSIRRFEDSQRG
ncbi:hypothetical protein IFO70_21845 [Phormidium tenue FACHB-886]|nr:hypothetical protein [Phormidium tenue FACHB-886]